MQDTRTCFKLLVEIRPLVSYMHWPVSGCCLWWRRRPCAPLGPSPRPAARIQTWATPPPPRSGSPPPPAGRPAQTKMDFWFQVTLLLVKSLVCHVHKFYFSWLEQKSKVYIVMDVRQILIETFPCARPQKFMKGFRIRKTSNVRGEKKQLPVILKSLQVPSLPPRLPT